MSLSVRTSIAFTARKDNTTREHEILRIAGRLPLTSSAVPAIDEILKWAQKRCGGTLPQEAWDHSKFDYLAGGRNSMAARFEDADHEIWAIRAEDPDKKVPGRIWTTEVVIGGIKTELPRFSARLLATTTEDELAVQPHSPGFAQQIIKNVGLVFGTKAAEPDPEFVNTEADLTAFVQTLLDPYRQLPIIALSCRSGQTLPMIDADALASAVLEVRTLSTSNLVEGRFKGQHQSEPGLTQILDHFAGGRPPARSRKFCGDPHDNHLFRLSRPENELVRKTQRRPRTPLRCNTIWVEGLFLSSLEPPLLLAIQRKKMLAQHL